MNQIVRDGQVNVCFVPQKEPVNEEKISEAFASE